MGEYGKWLSVKYKWILKFFFCSLIILRLLQRGHSFFHLVVSLAEHAKFRTLRARSKYFPRPWQRLFLFRPASYFSVQAPANVKPHCLPRWYRRVSLDNICFTKRIKKTILQLKVNKNLKRFWRENWPLNAVVNICDLFRERLII